MSASVFGEPVCERSPADRDVIAIRRSMASFGLTAQVHDLPDPAFSEALAAERADLNLGLISASFRAWACNAR